MTAGPPKDEPLAMHRSSATPSFKSARSRDASFSMKWGFLNRPFPLFVHRRFRPPQLMNHCRKRCKQANNGTQEFGVDQFKGTRREYFEEPGFDFSEDAH